MADSFQLHDDKLTIDLSLKKDCRFSDGTQITAEDVAKSLKRSILLSSPHVDTKNLWVGAKKMKSIDDEIEGIKVLSDKKLRFKLNHPTKEVLFYLTLTDLAILHKSQYSKEHLKVADWIQVTSGAYRVQSVDDNKLVFRANENSHNFSKSMPQQISFEGYRKKNFIDDLREKNLAFGTVPFLDTLKS